MIRKDSNNLLPVLFPLQLYNGEKALGNVEQKFGSKLVPSQSQMDMKESMKTLDMTKKNNSDGNITVKKEPNFASEAFSTEVSKQMMAGSNP